MIAVAARSLVLVSPTLLALSEALAGLWPTRRGRRLWERRLGPVLEEREGGRRWGDASLAWWTGPDARRHFRLGVAEGGPRGAPPLRLIYPDRVFLRGGNEWVLACPCGQVVPLGDERCHGPHCRECAGRDFVEAAPAAFAGGVVSADGRVSAELRSAFRLWASDVRTGAVLLDHVEGMGLHHVALSADGRTLAAAGKSDIIVWKMDDGAGIFRQAATVNHFCAGRVAFAGETLVAAGLSGVVLIDEARRWDLPAPGSADRVTALVAGEGWVVIAWASDEARRHGVVMLFDRDAAGWREAGRVSVPGLHRGWLSADGSRMAWCDAGEGVRLLELPEGKVRGRASWTDRAVVEAAFQGDTLLLRHDGGAACAMPLGVFPAAVDRPAPRVREPRVKRIATRVPEPQAVPPPTPRREEAKVQAGELALEQVWFGGYLALRRMGRAAHLAVQAVTQVTVLEPHPRLVEALTSRILDGTMALAVSPTMTHLAWADLLGLRLLSLANDRLILGEGDPLMPNGDVRSLAFSDDGGLLAFTRFGHPAVYSLATGEVSAATPLWDKGTTTFSHAFTPEGELLSVMAFQNPGGRPDVLGSVVRYRQLGARWMFVASSAIPAMRCGWLSPDGRFLAWQDQAMQGLRLHSLQENAELGVVGRGVIRSLATARFLPYGRLQCADAESERVNMLSWWDELGIKGG